MDGAMQALAILERAWAEDDLTRWPAVVLDALAPHIPYDVASYNEIGPAPDDVVELTRPEGYTYPPEVLAAWRELRDEHPLLVRYVRDGDRSAQRLTDVVDRATFQASALYQRVYEPLRVEYQMSCVLPAPMPHVVAIALSREDRDFTEAERDLLETVRPALGRCYAGLRHTATLQRALEHLVARAPNQSLLVVRNGSVRASGPRAVELLERWGRRAVVDAIATWLPSAHTGSGIAPNGETSTLLRRDAASLHAALVTDVDGTDLVVLTERPVRAEKLVRAGLRPREAEVVLLLLDGAGTTEIARTLGISEGTVRKHLERVNACFGVSSRAAAVAAAHAVLVAEPGRFGPQ